MARPTCWARCRRTAQLVAVAAALLATRGAPAAPSALAQHGVVGFELLQRAHGELLRAGMAERTRSLEGLRAALDGYRGWLSLQTAGAGSEARPAPEPAEVARLAAAVDADHRSMRDRNTEALKLAIVGYQQLGAGTSAARSAGVRRTALLRLADLNAYFGDLGGALHALRLWLGRWEAAAAGAPDGVISLRAACCWVFYCFLFLCSLFF
eukprot:SAG31_NODE_2941_length_4879_cov_80.338075_3_plen_210_part_00